MNPTRRPRRRERSRAAEVEQTLPEACGGTDEATEGARAVPEKRSQATAASRSNSRAGRDMACAVMQRTNSAVTSHMPPHQEGHGEQAQFDFRANKTCPSH
ncbi:Os01g0328200 [Oryza sativa Japonica Group]|jgi:hypothetical protein|uniref:Os01g0328200 protein n=1 Tax=Oryza sativa subsp. japonica TaxID=39947 RepID=Q0JN51_ORYSJ|nr:hypothetical protein OsJ_01556 [Oryza sativa Japonica Group]KAF2949923.1 hypothetical protein DAI22_01g152900 [Oryza sativa Japonica Group]KAF2949924.1 hypothetical protein DAI22_01g152900 [Oryza sativa Japonica Group]KAF2949925.1 hypothetical protein DAI22_01g152900 [Oryza sativa Japonica Group]KAF2949926.1 hypothetical protein DAI22_01g152900 [Oryza sativa Japonica Group]|eukprot:NP_001042913.1 Os01g0328200 [Oryza sativa Japonica Group]